MGKSFFDNKVDAAQEQSGQGEQQNGGEGSNAGENAGANENDNQGSGSENAGAAQGENKGNAQGENKFDLLGELNKTFKTSYKTPDEFGERLQRASKADEFEPKLSEYEKKIKDYETQVSELQGSLNPLQYFSNQEAFVAEQLRKQHPDKSPFVLQEIVTKDNKAMTDIDVLIKQQMLDNPDLIGGEQGAREYIYDKYGIDPSTPMTEWSTVLQNKIRIEARQARKAWDELKTTVQLPKIKTAEEISAEKIRVAEERIKVLTPLRETFSKSDKFTETIDDGKVLEYKFSDEDKAFLPEMFNKYMAEAGVEPTKENIADLEYLKDALILRRNIKQIYKVIEGDVEARFKAAQDKLLGNNAPNNTKSALELEQANSQKDYNDKHGLGRLVGKK